VKGSVVEVTGYISSTCIVSADVELHCTRKSISDQCRVRSTGLLGSIHSAAWESFFF